MAEFAEYVPNMWTRAGLEAAGYVGFVTFSELHTRGASIYVVMREPRDVRPRFLGHNAAGKARFVSEDVQALEHAWISGAEVSGGPFWGLVETVSIDG